MLALIYIFVCTFMVILAVGVCCFVISWCVGDNDEAKLRESLANYNCQHGGSRSGVGRRMSESTERRGVQNRNRQFSSLVKNVSLEMESISSGPKTSTILLNPISFRPLTKQGFAEFFTLRPLPHDRLVRSDSALENIEPYDRRKPVAVQIRIEDFDELNQSEVSLKGKLDLPVFDEPENEIEVKPIRIWKDGEIRTLKLFHQDFRAKEVLI